MFAFPALASRFGIRGLLLVGAFCLVLRGLVVVASSNPLVVVGAMALHGAGFALLLVGGVTYVASKAPAGSAATAQGVLAGVVFGLASAIGPGFGGVIAGATDIRTMYAISVAVSAVGLVALALSVGSWRQPVLPDAEAR
jgi:MFS family permease